MAKSDEHFKPLRLFDLARHSRFEITDEEKEHLHECEECQSILDVFARQFTEPPTSKPEDAA
jgi:hypothetical protein